MAGAATGFADADFTQITANFIKVSDKYTELKNLLNTLISNKVRDGDLDQSKLQSITSQLQNNIEAMTALIKAFTELSTTLAQALK
jgi:urease accessory protein UreF